MSVKALNIQQPFKVIFVLVNHPNLGFLIELHAVQMMPNGNFSMASQKIHTISANHYNLGDNQKRILKTIDETDPEYLLKKFVKSNKPIRVNDYFAKHYNKEIHDKIRPFIEKRIIKILEELEEGELYLAKDKHVTHTKVNLNKERAKILFHFRRNEEGTRYFATVKLGEQKINFNQNNSLLIVQEPAWVLSDNQLFTFEKDTDGNKIKPFLAKRFIHVEPKNERMWFEKFVTPLIEQYDVFAEGFEIRKEKYIAKPIIRLNHFGEHSICLSLYFQYGPYEFIYHSVKMVSVKMSEKNNQYVFHRVKRSRTWEDNIKNFLEQKGLKLLEGSLFTSIQKSEYGVLDCLNEYYQDFIEKGFIIDQSLLNRTFLFEKNSISFQISKEGDWFDLNAIVKFGQFTVPFNKLKHYLIKNQREFVLPDGSIAIIPEEWFTRYSPIFDFGKNDDEKIKIKKHHLELIEGIFEDNKEKKSQYIQKSDDKPLPKGLKAELRPYQMEGYQWLLNLKENKFGGCLADDMGLGKTLQVLSYFQYIKETEQKQQIVASQIDLFQNEETNICFTSLVVVPTSLIYNWLREINHFTNLSVHIHSGFNRNKSIEKLIGHYDLILTSYGTMRNDIEMLKEFKFHTIVLDESQAIKNPSSLTALSVLKLKSEYKFAMTGTPVENSITDLWSQLNFLNPDLLGNFHFFTKKYVHSIEKEKNEKDTLTLRNLVKPFILRRTKNQVASDLPTKTEQIRWCKMTPEQEKSYEKIKSTVRNELIASVDKIGRSKSQLLVLQGLIKLRQLANHPKLIDLNSEISSGKFEVVTEMIEKVIESNHKVLVFSQFVKHLELYKSYFDEKNIPYYFLDGSISSLNRKKLVDKFQSDENSGIFFLSLKAGGVGLNLTAADYVFILDPWWNPAIERQAMDRTHRIGQNKPVFVYKFITSDSIEEKILKLQNNKQKVSDDLIENEETLLKNLSQSEIQNLLE